MYAIELFKQKRNLYTLGLYIVDNDTDIIKPIAIPKEDVESLGLLVGGLLKEITPVNIEFKIKEKKR